MATQYIRAKTTGPAMLPNSAGIWWDTTNSLLKIGYGGTTYSFASTNAPVLISPTITTGIRPTTSDGAALGTGSYMFSDLFLAAGGVINWNNGNVTITHAAGKLTVAIPAPTSAIDGFTASFTSGSATPGTCRAIVGSATSYTSMTSGGLVGVRGVVTQAAAVSGASNYGVQGKYITGAFSAAGTLGAVYGQFDVTGGSLGAGNIAVIHANMVGCSAGAYALNGLYVEQAGGGYINSYARMLGNSTFVFDFESSFTNMSHTCSSVTNVGTKGYLKIQVANTTGTYTRYIALGDGIT
jgi:hypothetical protein